MSRQYNKDIAARPAKNQVNRDSNDQVSKAKKKAGEKAGCEAEMDKQPQKKEIGGPRGLEPTRYGDWEKAGRCIDF